MRQQMQLWGPETKDETPDISPLERVNMVLLPTPDSSRGTSALYGIPGTRDWVTFPARVRGWRAIGSTLYVVAGFDLVAVDASGNKNTVAVVSNTADRLSLSDNGTELIIVGGGVAELYTIGDVISDVIDFPGNNTVAYQGGRFLSEKDQVIWASDYADGATWDALTFASAESAPDNLIALSVYGNVIIAYGESTIEFWQNVGAAGFPYAPISSAAQVGLAAIWSRAEGSGAPYALIRDALGRLHVIQIAGYNTQTVTNERQCRVFGELSTVADARGFTYQSNGYEFYQLNFPTANQSWIYSSASQSWSRAEDVNGDALIGDGAVNFAGKRLVVAQDEATLFEIDEMTPEWAGVTVPRGFTSRNIVFNNRQSLCRSIELDIDAGEGIIGGRNPQIMMQISKDGGYTWGNERWRGMGTFGSRKSRAVWYRNGISREWAFRFRVTDPASRVIFAGSLADFEVAA